MKKVVDLSRVVVREILRYLTLYNFWLLKGRTQDKRLGEMSLVNDRAIQEEIINIVNELSRKERRRKIYNFYPDTGDLRRELYKPHMAFFEAGTWARERCMIAANGVGKCLPLDAPVLMGNGLRKSLCDININDYVMGYDIKTGSAMPVQVLQTTRSGKMDIFETVFSDGGTLRCTDNHFLPGYKRSGKAQYYRGASHLNIPKKRPLKEYMNGTSNTPSCRYSLLSPGGTFFHSDFGNLRDYLIHPYVVGAFLGDGSLNKEGITFHTIDDVILNRVKSYIDPFIYETRHEDRCTYRFLQKRNGENTRRGLLSDALREIGLHPLKCDEKTVPPEYLYGDIESRKQVLAGLVDTDGSKNEFTSKSRPLVDDFAFLVRSLGGKATIHPKKINGTTYWRCYWRLNIELPLSLQYKQSPISKNPIDYSRRIIREINYVGIEECGCITVNHPDHCFIAYDWIAVGNTEGVGGFELALHLTGQYPSWWKGKRFTAPINAWCAGDTTQTTRDILQYKLLGSPGMEGTGLIPGDCLERRDVKKKAGSVPDAIESVKIRHTSGSKSRLVFKSYDQRRQSFQGTEQHVILLDEECPSDVYEECLMRTRTVNGIILLTFTPLMGLTPLVLGFMPNGEIPTQGKVSKSKFIVNATWDDAPHLTEKEKEEILSGTMPYMRDARSKGRPQLGAGVVFPIDLDSITVDDFEIPPWYPKAYALDVGWNWTAVLWGAYDKESDCVYFYSCHKQSHAEPETHVKAINARGMWIPGVADPFGTTASNQRDGKKMINEYQNLGLNLMLAERKLIETGIFKLWERMISGRLKIFKSLVPLLNELRTYHRDEEGKIPTGQDDHLIDNARYFITSGMDVMTIMPYEEEEQYYDERNSGNGGKSAGAYFGKWY